jgi:carboxylesterase type B
MSTFKALQSHFYSQLLSCGDCLNTAVPDIIGAEVQLINTAYSIDPAAGFQEPIRPVLDGSLLTTSLTTTFPYPLKPLILTTVKDEGMAAAYTIYRDPVPAENFTSALTFTLGAERAALLNNMTLYPHSGPDIRPVFVDIATDQVFRCPTYTFARAWAAHGGTVYVGEFTLGATYPGNEDFAGCTSGGVCHQDDIYILFGTTPSPSADQSSLTAEVEARWSAFMRCGDPNVSGKTTWNLVSASGSVNALNLGGTSAIAEGACIPSFWGGVVRYEYQIFNE